MDESVQPKRLRVLLLVLILLLLVLGMVYIALSSQVKRESASTTAPPKPTQAPTFANPFKEESQNPFATGSSYQNPFGETDRPYTNPFGGER